uniref:Reverse transcriptase domain-containing protein n=1 Tax=Tanacetum cinerariifolium TaxID=118510 RepID=A0A699L294_TANCI|nr:reverse transcriptase domain-containing protein [Tanacetum cinerariifolium]
MEFTYALRFGFNATNNEAEYEALIAGLRIASQMGIQNLQANVDSKLVANMVNGIYIAKESSMIKYLEKVKNLANTFKGFSIKQIPIGENKKADSLRKITSTSFAHLSKQVLVEELMEKEIDEKEILAIVKEEGHTWMTLVYEYLTKGVLLDEKKKARTLRRKARRYAVIKNLDLLEEKREQAAIQEARNKAKMEGYYNARVRSTSCHPGDFVCRNNEASHAKDGGKLGPKWEGPYEFT